MWPSALQLTRDECRGILRRLELESYSNVISVFRAQGGLSEPKTKILEDLRNIFHISQERHRAEARRVANDEQLSTIAEAISGPNTWQEWSREGRRTYPLLPRVPPQTALCVVANKVAAEVTQENSKLPYPSETAANQHQQQEFSVSTERSSESVPIVTSDPYKPEIPDLRKTLKRNLPSETPSTTKKRIVSEISSNATTSETPINSATQIRKLYNNHSKTPKQKNNLSKKSTNSPMKRLTAANKKRLAGSGDLVDSNKSNNVSTSVFQVPSNLQPTTITTPSTTNLESNIQQPPPPPPPSSLSSQEICEPLQKAKITTPQIATSKKDISKNFSKLNMITNQTVLQNQEKLPECKTDKLSTPVQKYIVEERTPMLVGNAPTLPTHMLDKQQVITSKPKSMTAIVPTSLSSATKAKVTSVKTLKTADIVCSTPVTSQPQVFNVLDASTPPYVPHTPPAIINLTNKFEPEHGKVLKTKLLPLMLSSSGKIDTSNGSAAHIKNITSPSSSTTSTVFRKPNIIKTGVPVKQKIHITNQQIISPPTVASLKMSPHLHLKGVPGGGPIHNRNSVQIFSSPNGRVFIKPADSQGKPVTKLNTIVTGQKATGHILNTGSTSGRIAVQKVQIISAPSTTSTGNTVVPKQLAISKQNMIFMPMSATTPTVKTMPIVKANKYNTVLPTSMAQESSIANLTSAKSNVFVIGAVQSSPQTTLQKDLKGFNNRNSMITEDTPVDIITTPIIMDTASINTQTLKPTETIDLTTISDSPELTPEIIKPIATIPSNTMHSRLAPETCYVQSTEKPLTDDATTVVSEPDTNKNDDDMVIDVTDWEMELDQEANKTRALNDQNTRKRNNVEHIGMESGVEDGNFDEHFADDDVIEEQEETEEEIDDGCDMSSQDDGDNMNLLNKQQEKSQSEPQQRHHHDEDEETIEVGDEQMKSSEGDVIQYDESYESANDDLDENIAIEYVEEDQDGYDEKIDSTSSDQKDTMECNSNIVLIKQSSTAATTESTESSETKALSSKESMVSVEEISSTTQQSVSGSQREH